MVNEFDKDDSAIAIVDIPTIKCDPCWLIIIALLFGLVDKDFLNRISMDNKEVGNDAESVSGV